MTEQMSDKDLQRMKIYKQYEDGTGIGTVSGIRNVYTGIWKDFKLISRVFGNNEGAAFAACVQAWLSKPENKEKTDLIKKSMTGESQ